jgi:peptidoglycan/LPS O-acetylase OafA/YrhL
MSTRLADSCAEFRVSLTASTDVIPAPKLASYRPDVDGLRAVAVLSVVLFHAFPERLPGGFTGVDVFFVISGYLISGIIFRGLDQGSFRFSDFYSRRVRRIFPALALVLAVTFGLGWVTLFNDELKQLSTHILSGIGFVSNFQLMRESGYFDSAAELKPLLHLWSLGIEEQFYLVFPVLFFLLHRQRWNRTRAVVIALALSFLLNIALSFTDPTGAFYSPVTRFWELLLGSLLSLTIHKLAWEGEAAHRLRATTISIAGLSLVAAGMLLAKKSAPYPGWLALLPTIGTFLTIGAGMTSAVNGSVLSHPVLRWFGEISYPLYLWHWPLLVYARIIASGTPSVSVRIAIVAVSVVLAWLTSRAVENPLRFGGYNRPKVVALATTMVVLAMVGVRTLRNEGYADRGFNQVNLVAPVGSRYEALKHTEEGCGIESPEDSRKFGLCVHDTREAPMIAVVGDSKALALVRGLHQNAHAGSRILFIGGSSEFSSPLPLVTDDPRYAKHQPMIRLATDAVVRSPQIKVVIVTAATRALYQLRNTTDIEDLPSSPDQALVVEGLERAIAPLVAAGKKVILTVDNPTLSDPKDCVARRSSVEMLNLLIKPPPGNCSISRAGHLKLSSKYRAALDEVAARHPGWVRVFDTLPLLVDRDGETFRSIQYGQLYYSFSDHISAYAADLIGRRLIPFAEEFGELDRPPPR